MGLIEMAIYEKTTMFFICLLLLCFNLTSSYVSQNKILRSRVIQRYKNDQVLLDEEKYVVNDKYENGHIFLEEEKYLDDEYRESSLWEIFGHDNKFNPPTEEDVEPSFTPPAIGAWRNVFPEIVVENESPPKLIEYFQGKALGSNHEETIQKLWCLMKNRKSLKHLSEKKVWLLIEALRVAYISLWGLHTKRSLEVSINRARGTAAVLGELEASVDVVLSAILSDVLVELSNDTNNLELRRELSKRFGSKVIALSKSYNNLPLFMSKKADYTLCQSENQIQMLVAVSEEYRALYIRLADRLHTMRTLRSLPLGNKERLKIAEEALKVYAPLAHRMGIMKVKGELEDLAFKHIYPEMFQSTRYTQIAANKAYHEAMDAVQLIMTNSSYLIEQGVTSLLSYRIKDKYQLFLKMQRKNLTSVSQVRDALGMRIIAVYPRRDGESDGSYTERGDSICYHIVKELRNFKGWQPSERGFKDYIRDTKANGYQSLHQYIKNKALGTNVEVQVRTQAMHVIAELGEAAHWFYKDQIYKTDIIDKKIYKEAWRSKQQTAAKSPAELIGMAKKQLLANRVLVFLEDRSTVLNLKKGHTALDATFALHSDIGLTVSKVYVSGTEVKLDYVLQNGDVVTCENTPGSFSVKPIWISIAKSSSAQSKIRKYFRDNNRAMLICVGLMHFLMSLTLSEERILLRYPKGVPSIDKLSEFIKKRTPCITNFAGFLERLGGASKIESASLLGSLLDIPASNITVSTIRLGLIWARMSEKNGWDSVLQKNLLLPLLRDILPSFDLHLENMWIELIGKQSVMIEEKETLLPLEDLLTSKLGPAGKRYNFFTSVTQAPEHTLIPTLPPSSLINSKEKISPMKYESVVLEKVRLYKALNSVHPPLISMTEEGFDEVSVIQHQKCESSLSLSSIEGLAISK